ncbi:hypothetical protein [Actinomadura sp. 6N118]|uniref:hypothetical protein n=1 Tax=Actinomadura sp. 6N118 TaxID=3375151 RepID=UPI0037A350A5
MLERWGNDALTLLFEDGVRPGGINRPVSPASVSLLYPVDAAPCWTNNDAGRIPLPEPCTARLLRLTP